jgi:hypothetical protein
MMVGAVEGSGSAIVISPVGAERRFTDLAGFEECLRLAAQLRDAGAIGPAQAAAAAWRAQSGAA